MEEDYKKVIDREKYIQNNSRIYTVEEYKILEQERDSLKKENEKLKKDNEELQICHKNMFDIALESDTKIDNVKAIIKKRLKHNEDYIKTESEDANLIYILSKLE